MKKMILILVAVAVSTVGFLLGRASASASPAESEQGQLPVNCSISTINGSLKGFTTVGAQGYSFMMFEDSTGVIRIINSQCQVKYKFNRQ
ncbi:MAG: hypothetical protein ND866_31040 [Pyrinomonadaceae bacterium]|nr:hypothetical protein [Pyrinomonadaceae bacterium]